MSVEIRPLGVTCNLRCDYCYEAPMRACSPTERYQREKVLAAIDKLNCGFSLFGGEALLLPLPALEELLQLSFERHGHSGIQTNGSLITDAHIEVFKKYHSNIGISIDGPGELNDARWAGTLDATRTQTAKSEAAIRKLVAAGLTPSLIVTLHSGNLSKDAFPRFVAWLHELDELGITHVNIHALEMDDKADKWSMSSDEYADRYIDLWQMRTSFKGLQFAKFREILDMLQGNDNNVVCIWRSCDPWNTDAAQSIEHDGAPSHCSRSNKDGNNWLLAEGDGNHDRTTEFIGHPGTRHYERQLALAVTPQEVGGCKDCPYWLACMSNCPGTGENHDWRQRTTHCQFYKRLFEHGSMILRGMGKAPLGDWPYRKEIESRFYDAWATNKARPSMRGLIQEITGMAAVIIPQGTCARHTAHDDSSGGHGDAPHGDSDTPVHSDNVAHGDAPHGDNGSGHGDIPHGDGNIHDDGNGRCHSDSNGRPFHTDHGDATRPSHGDRAHGDGAHGDGYQPIHHDSQRNNHGDRPHGDRQ